MNLRPGRVHLFLLLAVLFKKVANKKYVTEESILKDAVFDREPDARVRPLRHSEQPIEVFLEYQLNSILKLDQIKQKISLAGRLYLTWKNDFIPYLHFNKSRDIVVRIKSVWFPNIIIKNSAMDVFGDLLDEAKYRVKIHSSGQMSYKIAGKTDTFCQMNLFFFPFDQQMCFLEFTSWTYSESQLKFRELAKSLDVEKFAENEQWSLVRTEVTYFPFNISQTTLSVIRITLYVKRKPLYHTLTLIIPCILVSYLITLIFLLPADSKEKSIFGISTLLTYNVFQASINDRMPKAAQSLPIITIYISAVMFFSAISILASIFVLMVYYDKSSQPPTPFLQKIIPKNKLKYIKSNLQHLQKSKEQSNCLQTSYIGNYHTSRSKLGAHVRTKEPSKTREDSKKRAAKRWKKLGIKILDKVARRKQLTTKLLTSRLFKNILKSDLPSPEDDVRLLWVAVAEQIDLYLFYSFFIVNSVAAITFLLYLPLRAPS